MIAHINAFSPAFETHVVLAIFHFTSAYGPGLLHTAFILHPEEGVAIRVRAADRYGHGVTFVTVFAIRAVRGITAVYKRHLQRYHPWHVYGPPFIKKKPLPELIQFYQRDTGCQSDEVADGSGPPRGNR